MKTRNALASSLRAIRTLRALAGALLSLSLAAALSLSLAPVARAQPFPVTVTGSIFTISSSDDITNSFGTLPNLTFGASGTVEIASGLTITFDGNNGAGNHLAFPAVTGGFVVDDNSTLTFSNNVSTANGGAITASGAANGNFNLAAVGSGSYVFSGNHANQGGAIALSGGNPSTANIQNASFTGNYSTTGANGGGAIFMNSANATLTLTNVLFDSNTAGVGGAIGGGGGAISISANNTTLNITNATFENNYANANTAGNANFGGGAFFTSANNLTFSATNVRFTGNATTQSGGAMTGSQANSLIMSLNNVVFSSNTAGLNGGAINNLHNQTTAAGWSTVTYTDVSFLKNVSTGGLGGAIYQTGGANDFNVTTSATFAGNTDSTGANSIYFAPGPNNTNQPYATFNISGGANLDMLDPMTAAPLAGKTLIMSATGAGVWNLGGMNNLDSTPFTVYTGTLHLYRAGEVANPTATNPAAQVAAGSLNLTGASSSFALNGAATLLAGGGNSIAAPASAITLGSGATLALDLKGASSTTSLLTLNAPTLSVTWSTININLLNSDWLAAQVSTYTTSQTYDLLTLTGDTTAAHLFSDPNSFATLTGMDALTAAGFQLQLSGNNILQLYYYLASGLTNNILNWTGATDTTWLGADNWQISGTTDEATFQRGDIVNLAVTTPAPASGTNTITITASATAGGIFVSGNQSYALTGDGITADAAASVLTRPAATGKLILGQSAAADGSIVPADVFTGVLDLTGQGTAINKFVNGVDIYSGALRIATTDQLGALLSKVNFLGTPATTTGTLIIASGNNLAFDSAGAAGNRLSLGAGNSAAFVIEDSATLTFSSNTTAAAGGAINLVGAGSLLTLAAGDNAQYVFKNNTVTGASGNGGAIALAANATLTLANAMFQDNTATSNGGALFGAIGNTTLINLTDVSFLDNHSSGNGGAIGLSGAAATTTLNINVSDDAISRFAGNTDSGGRNAISINYASAGAQSTVNINVGAGGLLDMLDPIRAMTDTANTGGVQFNKNGDGVWALAGSSTFAKWGNTGASSAGIAVNQGQLYLYGAKDGPASGYPIEAAKVIFVAQGGNNAGSNGNARFLFTLGSGGTLGVGGGNSISFASTNATGYGNATIAMAQGSVVDFKLDNAIAGGATGDATETSMLTINASLMTAGLNIVSGGLLNPTISLDYAAATPQLFVGGTYNLFTLNAASGFGFDALGTGATLTTALNAIRGTALFGADGLSIGELHGEGYTANFGLTGNNILWVSFDYFTAVNQVLTWTGNTAGSLWQNNNWVLTADLPTLTPTPFANGDIANLAPTATVDTANNTNTITLDAATTATAAGILVTGNQNYTIDGNNGAYGLATASSEDVTDLSGPAALGKLILGAQATKTASLDTTTAFTGTLDLTKTAANTFTGGVDIYSGALRISTTDQLGTTLNHLTFLGDPAAPAPATLQIAAGQSITFDSSLTGAENHLTLLANTVGNIVLENGATLTFTNNTAANGAAINLAAGATLNLAAAPTASFLFANNTATANGAAIYGVANSSVTLVNATFASNTAANGAALYNASAGGLFTGTNLTFRNNTATANGGAIALGGASSTPASTLRADGVLFDANTANNGGAISISTGGTLVLTSATFQNNIATQRGAVLYTSGSAPYYIDINGALFQSNTSGVNYANTSNLYGGAIANAAQQATFIITSATFRDNTAIAQSTSGQGGGAIASTSPNSSFTLNNVLFQNNTVSGTGNGGAIMASTNTPFTLQDVSFIANTAQGDGNGGAIYYSGGGTLTLNVTSGSATLYADNTAGPASAPSGIYFAGTAANTLNVNVGSLGSLDMLDPMAASDTTTLSITKTGAGVWNLGSDNTLGAAASAITFAVTSGTLHLYRANEHDTTGAHPAATGNLTLASPASAFTLGDDVNPATLSAGGGNTITANTITLADNATLALDLTGATAAAADGTGYSVLTLNANTGALTSNWTQTLNLLNLDTLTSNPGDTYNLITLGNGNLFTDFTTLNLPDLLPAGYSLQLADGNNSVLQLFFAQAVTNNVLNWTGANGSSWSGTNWALATDGLTAATFAKGDIINLVGPPAPVTNTLEVDTTTSATIAGMYLSGNQNYTVTGAATINAIAGIGTFSGSDAATGKLILGASAAPDAGVLDETPAAAYTGTLTLENASNTFTAGIVIHTGALVGNDKTLGVGTSGSILNDGALTFNQVDNGTYTSIISGNGTLAKTGAGTLTLTANNTLTGLTTINAGSLILGTPASALAGDINVNATALLGGVGTAGGNVTIANGATLMAGLTHNDSAATTAPDSSEATGLTILTIGGALTLNAGATLLFDLYANNQSDHLNVESLQNLTTTGTIDLNTALSGTYTLINIANALGSTGISDIATYATTIAGASIDTLPRVSASYATPVIGTTQQVTLTIGIANISGTWTGAAGAANLWNTAAANWLNPADTAFYNGDAVTFGNATSGAITVDTAGVTAADMTIDTASAYTFTGGAITTSTAGTSITDPAIATGKLTITGSGLVILANTGANNFEEGITIANAYGTLQGTVDTLHTGGIITDNGTLVFDQAASATFTGTILGAGSLAKQNTGNLTLSGSTGYTGFTFLNAGALTLANENQIASSAVVFIAASSTLYTGDNAQTINALQSIEALSGGDGGSVVTGTGALTLVNQGGNATIFSGVISGAAAVIKTGSQDFALAGNNTFTGPLTIEEGLLNLGNNSANGTIAQSVFVTINAGATLNLSHADTNYTMSNTFAGGGNINKLDTGTLTLTANSLGFSGDTEVFGGALVLANASLGGELKLYAGAQLAGTGTLGNVTTTLGSATITIGDLNSTTAQTLALTGTLTLAGDNTLNYDLLGNGIGDRITAAALVRGVGSPYPDIINIGVNSSLSGTYTLITTTETLSSIVTNNLITLSNGGTLGSRSVATYTQDANNLYLAIVTNNITGLVWDGTAGSTWQDNTANWKNYDGKFLNGDSVVFDDTRSGTNLVNVVGNVQTVDVIVTTTTSYTFAGSGGITTSNTINSTVAPYANGAFSLLGTGLVVLANTGTNYFQGGISGWGINVFSGTLQGNATTFGGANILNASALIFDQATDATYDAIVQNSGLLVKQNTGALTLANASNSYTGGINVLGGVLNLPLNPAGLPLGPINIAANAALNITIDEDQIYVVQSPLTGSGTLSISLGTPTATLLLHPNMGGSTFEGTVNLGTSAFDLSQGNTAALAHATLGIGTGNTTTVGTGTYTFAGLAINGGKLIFSTTIPADLQAAGTIQTTTLAIGTSGTIQVAIPATVTDPATTGATLFAQSTGTTIDKLVSATTVTGAANIGSLKLVDQTGADVAASAKTAAITQAGATVATGTYTYKLDATGGLNVNYALASLTIETGKTLALAPVAGDTGAFNALISGNGNLAIDATIAPVTLGAANNFTGTTTVTAGTLIAGIDNALGAATAPNSLVLSSSSGGVNAAFDLNGKTQTLATLNTDATTTVNLANGALTVSNGTVNGTLTGAGALTVKGGNLTINYANPNMTAPTNIAASSTVTAASLQSLGTGDITLAGNGAPNTAPAKAALGAAAPTVNSKLETVNSGGVLAAAATSDQGVLIIANTASGTLANTINGAGSLNLNGTGTTTIAKANTAFTGQTAITGPVVAANTAALGSGAIAINGANASLTYTTTGEIANAITGANGTLNLAGTGGDTTLSGNNTITTINALAGSNIVVATASALNSTNLGITNATVTLTQNNTTLGNVTMNGASTLGFAKGLTPGNTIKLTSLAAPAGSTPTLALNTDIGAPAPIVDQLVVSNPAANTGAFNLALNNAPDGKEPVITGTNGISLPFINDQGGATISGTGVITNSAWKHAINWGINEDGSPTIDITQGAAGPSLAAIIANATGAMPLTWFAELDTLNRRLGDLTLAPRAKPAAELWLRGYAQRVNVNDKDTLAPFHETQYGTEVGADYGGKQGGYSFYTGAFLGYGGSHRTLNDVDATGDTTSAYGGVYITYVNDDGWYADLVAKYNQFKNTLNATSDNGTMSGRFNSNALGASLEAGKRIELRNGWYVTPNAQAAAVALSSVRYTTSAGMTVTQDTTTAQQLRAGVQTGFKHPLKNGQLLQPYAKLYAGQQWSRNGAVAVDKTDYGAALIRGFRMDAGAGVNWQVRQNLQVYFDYDFAWAKDYTKPYGLTLGITYAW